MFSFGDLGFLSRLPRVSAAEARLNPSVVRFSAEIEPLVRLLEDTPRERLLEEVGPLRVQPNRRHAFAAHHDLGQLPPRLLFRVLQHRRIQLLPLRIDRAIRG